MRSTLPKLYASLSRYISRTPPLSVSANFRYVHIGSVVAIGNRWKAPAPQNCAPSRDKFVTRFARIAEWKVSASVGLAAALAALSKPQVFWSETTREMSDISSSAPAVAEDTAPNGTETDAIEQLESPVVQGGSFCVSGDRALEHLPDMKVTGGSEFPDVLTEFMVNMTCEGCVKAVRNKVEPLRGVRRVDVDLENQVVRILGSATVKSLITAIEATGRAVRLIGQGVPSEFTVSAAVAEFKGPQIHGVIRFAQISMESSKIEAYLSGLTPGKHAWSINMYGDLTRGAASTGDIYKLESPSGSITEAMGDLGTLEVGNDGKAEFSGRKLGLQVHDLIGRAVVIYENEDKSMDGITAAVIARSAGVGQNYKKLCSCDGTIIWDSTDNDYVKL